MHDRSFSVSKPQPMQASAYAGFAHKLATGNKLFKQEEAPYLRHDLPLLDLQASAHASFGPRGQILPQSRPSQVRFDPEFNPHASDRIHLSAYSMSRLNDSRINLVRLMLPASA